MGYLTQEKPYFMENEEWYTECDFFESEDGRGYHLTDKAPKEAVESYMEFYEVKQIEVGGKVYEVQ